MASSNQEPSTLISIKCYSFDGEIRRFSVRSQEKNLFAIIRNKIQKFFFPTRDNFTITYRNDEGNSIAITTDNELLFAIKKNPKILKLYLQNNNSDELCNEIDEGISDLNKIDISSSSSDDMMDVVKQIKKKRKRKLENNSMKKQKVNHQQQDYKSILKELWDIGFRDMKKNIQLIKQYQGDLNKIVTSLLDLEK